MSTSGKKSNILRIFEILHFLKDYFSFYFSSLHSLTLLCLSLPPSLSPSHFFSIKKLFFFSLSLISANRNAISLFRDHIHATNILLIFCIFLSLSHTNTHSLSLSLLSAQTNAAPRNHTLASHGNFPQRKKAMPFPCKPK